jgi:phosphoadenosine phosphosulfate reductase
VTLDLNRARELFADQPPEEILQRAAAAFPGKVALSSSFQTQSVPLLHLLSRFAPEIPVLFLDTGYHFPETLAFRDRLVREWGLRLEVLRAAMPLVEVTRRYGPDLFRSDPDLCCEIHKVEPMRRAVRGLEAWISGIRRDQTAVRQNAQIVEAAPGGLMRIHPLLNWTERDVWSYMHRYDLPSHPLFEQGYESVGCAPCTAPVQIGDGARSGRWQGTNKAECGLHTDLRQPRRAAGNEET